jgi:hypothetical protein
MSVARFERFYRRAAGVDVDKEDIGRHSDFVGRKLRDLLVVGQAVAGANGRDVTEPFDLPITKGLQETIHRFRTLDADIELRPVLEQLASLPPLDRPLSDRSIARMPEIAGGLSLALARTFVLLDPRLANPQSRHWEQAFRTFDLLL